MNDKSDMTEKGNRLLIIFCHPLSASLPLSLSATCHTNT